MYIKEFNRFIYNKAKYINCLQCFSSERVLTDHKEICWKTNDKQTVKSKNISIKLKSCFKHLLAAGFKIYADLECKVIGVERNDKSNVSYTQKYQDHIPFSFV